MTNEWPLLPTLTSEGLYASVNGPLLRDKGTNNGISIGDWRLPAEQTCDRGSVPQNDGPTTIDDMTMSIRYASHAQSALLAASFYDHKRLSSHDSCVWRCWSLLAMYSTPTLRCVSTDLRSIPLARSRAQ